MINSTNKIMLILLTIVLFGISVFFRKLSVDRLHPYCCQFLFLKKKLNIKNIIAAILAFISLALFSWK